MFKKLLIVLLMLSSLTVFAESSSYVDVSSKDWYFRDITLASKRQWVRGYGNGVFKPNQELTIGEALHITLKMLGYKQPADQEWLDWTEENSKKADLILPLEFYDLNQPILRKEMVLIGLRVIDRPLEYDYMAVSQKISDLNDVSYYWQQILIKGYAHGIITGYGGGYVKPDQTMTRAEGMIIINRLFNKI